MSGLDEKNTQLSGVTAPQDPAAPGGMTQAKPTPDGKTEGSEPDSFDYITPKETYKQHRRRRRKRRRERQKQRSAANASSEERESADVEYVFAKPVRRRGLFKRRRRRHRHRFRRLSKGTRVLLTVLIVILALLTALAGTVMIMNEIGKNSMKPDDKISVALPTEDESGNDVIMVDNSGRVITYDGISYEMNDDLVALTFIGVDDGVNDQTDDIKKMSDAIYIFALDTKTGKIKVLSISRDTMTDVDVYSEQGQFIDTQRMQIAYSYSFGNDTVSGGKNTNTSLMRLFYGMPFKNYFAINMDALITLNDAIGGVTLPSSMTFVSPEDGRTISEGETVTLRGKEAEAYVRSRDTEQLASNNARMQRQQEYIRAFLESAVPAAKKDLSVVSKLYGAIAENSESSLDLPKITYIASAALTKLSSEAEIEYLSLNGTITEGEYAELTVTNEDAIRTMLDVFYKPLARVPGNTE